MTAGYSIDGETICKSSVKSESHTFFLLQKYHPFQKKPEKKYPLAVMLNSQNIPGTMAGGTTEDKFTLFL